MKYHSFAILLIGLAAEAHGQGTAFTYQGRLTDNGSPANGRYDLSMAIFSNPGGGVSLATPVTNNAVLVQNGLFTVPLDFGSVFPGADRWLEISTRTNGPAAFTTLTPRQLLTPTPYAITARNVTGVVPGTGLSGTYSAAVTLNNANNSFSGNGAGLTGLWKTAGNAGTVPPGNFLGTTDNQPLELRVNGTRALRLQPSGSAAPNVIGGSPSNAISSFSAGATIAGGDRNFIEAFNGAVSDFAAIGGGSSNQIGYFSFNSVVAGGLQNVLEPNDYFSVIAGGLQNHMGFHTVHCAISGGRSNFIENSVDASTINGGAGNSIGYLAHFANIAAGKDNLILSNAESASVSGGQENSIGAGAHHGHIGGGNRNKIQYATYVTISGGAANSADANASVIAGGSGNAIQTNAYESSILGGFGNIIHTNANRSTIGGGAFHEIIKDAGYSFIGGGTRNMAGSNAYHATITGGSNNSIDHDTSYCSVGGGKLHTVGPQSAHATIAGGDGNSATGEAPAIGGGTLNTIESGTTYGVIAGGGGNRVGAGTFSSTIAGGYLNQVIGDFSFAAGNRAQANHPGTFSWAGGNTMPYASIFPYSVNLYSSNGVSMDYGVQTAAQPRGTRYVYVGPINSGLTIATWNGARLTDGGIWSNASDKNRKTDFKEIDPRDVLDKVLALPVRQWRYTNESANIKHLGPVAQDFRSSFGLGIDDTSIGTVDADGVALAAIQGLNRKLRDELSRRDAENAELRRRLDRLEQLVTSNNGGQP